MDASTNRSGVEGSTHDKTTTRPGRPSAWRLGPLPRAWRGWTPRLAVLTRLHGLRPPAPAWRRARGAPRKRGYLRWELRSPVRSAPSAAWPAAPGWTPGPGSLRSPLRLRRSPPQVAALALGAGAAPPKPLTAAGAAWPAVAVPRGSAPPATIGPAGAGANRGAAAGRLAPCRRRCRRHGS